jgi:hypothetical protein
LEYSVISAMPWAEPYNPGATPLIAAGTNAVESAHIARLHDEFICIHINRINVEPALKSIILEAYDNMYTSQLDDYLLQYANPSALEISMHLKQTYVFINPRQLAEKYNKMTAPINFQDPIEALFNKIEDVVRYANSGMQPYMEEQYVNNAFLLILNTCVIPDACRDWEHRTPVNKTWSYFRCEFVRAQREQRIISRTDSGAGYHTAIVAEYYVQIQIPADGGFITAIDNFSTTTFADPETFVTLNKAIATLTDQLAEKDIWAKSKEAEIKGLLGGCAPNVAIFDAGPDGVYISKSYKTNNDNYCWSHDYQVGMYHTSANYTKKAYGHKDEATKDNIMGGNTWGSKFM